MQCRVTLEAGVEVAKSFRDVAHYMHLGRKRAVSSAITSPLMLTSETLMFDATDNVAGILDYVPSKIVML